MVSSQTHPSNVHSKRGLQRVQYMYVQLGREKNTLEKRSYTELHLKKNGKQAINIL